MNSMAIRPIKGMKKGEMAIDSIGPVALSIGIAVIIVAVVAMILGNMKTNVTDANATYVLTKGLAAMSSFADWFSIIVIVVVAVIILALVMLLRGRGGGGA